MESLKQSLFQKYILDEHTNSMLEAIVEISAQHESKQFSEQLKKNIMKLALKVAVLYKQRVIMVEQFKDLRVSFRRVCSSIVNSFRLQTVHQSVNRIEKLCVKFQEDLLQVLAPVVSEAFVTMIKETISYIGSSGEKF